MFSPSVKHHVSQGTISPAKLLFYVPLVFWKVEMGQKLTEIAASQ
jgi:hypothetical protein